ncbi:MAG: hypothetical protein ABIH39_06640 [Candidatus Margulisiibacteriota bacterium]
MAGLRCHNLKYTFVFSPILYTFYFIYITLILSSPTTFASEKVPIDIKADNLLYQQTRDLIIASGNVQVAVENARIIASRLWIDTAGKVLWASGDVTVQQESTELSGQFLFYDIISQNVIIHDLNMISDDPEIKGHLYLSTQKMMGRIDELIEGEVGSLTTCEYDHYNIEADRFVYIPEDRIEGFNVRFNVNHMPLFWTPYYIFWLKSNDFVVPIIGHNETEGWFIKSGHNYRINQYFGGILYLDYMQNKGMGIGAKNKYILDNNNSGTSYHYYINEKDTGIEDWVFKFDHDIRLNQSTSVNIKYDGTKMYLVPNGRVDRQLYDIALTHTHTSGNSRIEAGRYHDLLSGIKSHSAGINWNNADQSLNYKYQFQDYQQNHFNESQQLYYKKTILPGLDTSARLNFYRNGDFVNNPDEKLNSEFTIKHTASDLYQDMQIDMSMYNDLDRELYQADNTLSYLEKLPEVRIQLKSADLDLFTVNPSVGVGRYHEVQYLSTAGRARDFTSERFLTILRLSKRIPLGWGSSLDLSRQYEQYWYTPGDSQFVNDDHIGVNTALGSYFSNQIDFNSKYSCGQSPFYFDTKGNLMKRITDGMSLYDGDLWRYSLNGGYNFLTETYDDLGTELTIKPHSNASYRFRTGYSLEADRDKFKDLVTSVILAHSERTKLKLDNSYDLNEGVLKSASSELCVGIGRESYWEGMWDICFRHSYEAVNKRYMLRYFEITKDLHCWKCKFSYDHYREEYLLIFTLKAWDNKPLRLYGGREGFKMETDFEKGPSRI